MDGSYAAHPGAHVSSGSDAGGHGGSSGGYGNSQGRGSGQWGRGGSEGGGAYGGRSNQYRDSRGGGNGGSGGGRGGGDWTCSNPSCGNVNFARRSECNKCGAVKPGGVGRSNPRNDQFAGGGYAPGGGQGSENSENWRSGKNAGFGNFDEDDQGSGFQGYRPEQNRDQSRSGDFSVANETVKVKQCDETCDESCENTRIYISGLPLDVSVDELRDLFGGIGQVARLKQKRGYKDQWPWSIKIYSDESGNIKGDAVLTYEDPSAAHSAGGFFSGHVLRGHEIKVTMAEKSAPKGASDWRGSGGRGGNSGFRGGGRGGSGGYGGGGYGGNRSHFGGGPDRRDGGGNRPRPY